MSTIYPIVILEATEDRVRFYTTGKPGWTSAWQVRHIHRWIVEHGDACLAGNLVDEADEAALLDAMARAAERGAL